MYYNALHHSFHFSVTDTSATSDIHQLRSLNFSCIISIFEHQKITTQRAKTIYNVRAILLCIFLLLLHLRLLKSINQSTKANGRIIAHKNHNTAHVRKYHKNISYV